MASKLGFTKTSQPKCAPQDITSWLSYFVSPVKILIPCGHVQIGSVFPLGQKPWRTSPQVGCIKTDTDLVVDIYVRSLLMCLYPKNELVISSKLLQVPIFLLPVCPPRPLLDTQFNLEAGSFQARPL